MLWTSTVQWQELCMQRMFVLNELFRIKVLQHLLLSNELYIYKKNLFLKSNVGEGHGG